jgi:hypothetical protein
MQPLISSAKTHGWPNGEFTIEAKPDWQPPTLTDDQMRDAIAALEIRKQALKPQDFSHFAHWLRVLMRNFWQDRVEPDAVDASLIALWFEILGTHPEWAFKHAVKAYISSGKARKPLPGDLLPIMENEVEGLKLDALLLEAAIRGKTPSEIQNLQRGGLVSG